MSNSFLVHNRQGLPNCQHVLQLTVMARHGGQVRGNGMTLREDTFLLPRIFRPHLLHPLLLIEPLPLVYTKPSDTLWPGAHCPNMSYTSTLVYIVSLNSTQECAPKNLTHFSYTPSLFLNEVELHSLSSLSARVLWLIGRQSPLYKGSWQRCIIYTFYCFYFVHGEFPVKIHKLNCKYAVKLLNLHFTAY